MGPGALNVTSLCVLEGGGHTSFGLLPVLSDLGWREGCEGSQFCSGSKGVE